MEVCAFERFLAPLSFLHRISARPDGREQVFSKLDCSNHIDVLESGQPSTVRVEKYRAISIGYRHINVMLHTDVMWNEETYAQFPHEKVLGGHQLNLTHQFCEHPGTWTVRPKDFCERPMS